MTRGLSSKLSVFFFATIEFANFLLHSFDRRVKDTRACAERPPLPYLAIFEAAASDPNMGCVRSSIQDTDGQTDRHLESNLVHFSLTT